MTFQTELDLPETALATMPGLLLLLWRQPPTVEAAGQLADAYDRILRRSDERWMLLTAVDGRQPLPTSDVREPMQRYIKTMERRLSGVAVAIEGQGFGPAANRAFLSGIYLLTRPPYPVKVHSDVRSAAAWLVGLKGVASGPLSEGTIVGTVNALRAGAGGRAATSGE